MKYFFFVIKLLFSCLAFSQQRDSIIVNNKVFYADSVYLDSVKVNLSKTYLDPDNVREVTVLKANPEQPFRKGALMITRKNPVALVQLNTIFVRDSIPVKFIINGKYIEKA